MARKKRRKNNAIALNKSKELGPHPHISTFRVETIISHHSDMDICRFDFPRVDDSIANSTICFVRFLNEICKYIILKAAARSFMSMFPLPRKPIFQLKLQ